MPITFQQLQEHYIPRAISALITPPRSSALRYDLRELNKHHSPFRRDRIHREDGVVTHWGSEPVVGASIIQTIEVTLPGQEFPAWHFSLHHNVDADIGEIYELLCWYLIECKSSFFGPMEKDTRLFFADLLPPVVTSMTHVEHLIMGILNKDARPDIRILATVSCALHYRIPKTNLTLGISSVE